MASPELVKGRQLTDAQMLHAKTIDKLEPLVRDLGFLLACEEESGIRLKDQSRRKYIHDKLLAKLYRIEKKSS